MLAINNLHVCVQDETQTTKEILCGIDLTIQPGEVHVLMGPNGSGKSTLANVLAGREGYQITQGSVKFNDEDLLSLAPEERAARGVFLAFQYPIEIPGVNNMYFLRTALNSLRQRKNLPPMDAADFLKHAKAKIKAVGLDESFLQRAVNEGFSGGEKKRNEIFQMLVLEPSMIILDETDSGVDMDALQLMAQCVASIRNDHRSILVVTHYQRWAEAIKPDVVHVMTNGKILKSGDKTLVNILEAQGFGAMLQEVAT